MEVRVQMDVPVKVVVKGGRLILRNTHAGEEGPKHTGYDVLAAQRQGRRHAVGAILTDEAEGGLHERPRRRRHLRQRQGPVDARLRDPLHKGQWDTGVRPHLPHGVAVKLEVAGVALGTAGGASSDSSSCTRLLMK